jgi:phosphate transport system substrate-binding protein
MKKQGILYQTLIILLTVALLPLASTYAVAEEIEIVGTGDGTQVLKAVGVAFGETRPGVSVAVPKSIGSGGGIKAVGEGQNKIGRVARPIKDREKPFGLSYAPFAKVPVVFFTNPRTGVTNLTAEQVCAIYSGTITNWQEVGGNDEKIRVVRREDGDSSLEVLTKTFPGFKDIVITEKSKTALKTAENFTIVESKSGTIGFGPYDIAKDSGVTIVQIDGKSPTDPGYPSFTTLALVYKEENRTGALGEFIAFATSSSARPAIEAANGIPVN